MCIYIYIKEYVNILKFYRLTQKESLQSLEDVTSFAAEEKLRSRVPKLTLKFMFHYVGISQYLN